MFTNVLTDVQMGSFDITSRACLGISLIGKKELYAGDHCFLKRQTAMHSQRGWQALNTADA